jgi:regulator of protease activity HflC (stomatin/prohibitin superfamily)
MAEIRKYPWLRHLRSEPSFHVLRHSGGALVASGRGLTFWFLPINTSVAELPMDDRDMPFLFHGRTKDYQEVIVQGTIAWRVADPEVLAQRVDFTIDLGKGVYQRQPFEQIVLLLTGIAQQAALRHIAEQPLRALLEAGPGPVQERIRGELAAAQPLADMGLRVVTAQVADIAPTAEMEGALQTPMREKIQEAADKARFERRAQAVEEERAIGENELQSKIELARRQERLIEQQGQNKRREVTEEAEAKRIDAAAAAARRTLEAEAAAGVTRIDTEVQAERARTETETEAGRIHAVEGERVAAEREKMEIYRTLPLPVLLGLAAQDLAEKLKIEHLTIAPDQLLPALERLVRAGAAQVRAK